MVINYALLLHFHITSLHDMVSKRERRINVVELKLVDKIICRFRSRINKEIFIRKFIGPQRAGTLTLPGSWASC